MEPDTTGSVTIDVFGGCPGVTHTIMRVLPARRTPAFAAFALSGSTVTVAVTSATRRLAQTHTAYYVVTPLVQGAQQRVGVTMNVIA